MSNYLRDIRERKGNLFFTLLCVDKIKTSKLDDSHNIRTLHGYTNVIIYYLLKLIIFQGFP